MLILKHGLDTGTKKLLTLGDRSICGIQTTTGLCTGNFRDRSDQWL